MKNIRYLLATVLLIQNVFLLSAQTTEGNEFWVTFGIMTSPPMTPTTINNFEYRIRIVNGNYSTVGSIFFTDLGISRNFSIEPYEVYDYTLDNTEKYVVYNSTAGTSNNSIQITTSNFVSAYALGRYLQYCDVTNLLPLTTFGTEYRNLSYRGQINSYQDAYLVVATQNNTHLYHNGDSIATLNAGQVYYNTSATDMTGTHITSNYPIALFAAHQGTIIPFGIGCVIFQQISPVNTFGKTFFVPFAICENERIRIVVTQKGTDITQTGGTIQTLYGGQPILTNLQAGNFVELEMLSGSNGCYITSNYPVGVCSYMRSYSPTGVGCPLTTATSQTWIPAIEQSVSKVILAPFILVGPNPHFFALICTPTDTKENTKVSIGGTPPTDLSDQNWYDNAASGMSFCSFELTGPNTAYIFSNPKGIIVFGYGTVGQSASVTSYYYLAGSAMRDLEASFYVNDIHYQDLHSQTICTKDVNFSADISGFNTNTDSLRWYIDDGVGEIEEMGARDQLEWSKTFSNGIYQIRMQVLIANQEPLNRTSTLKIESLWIKIRNVRN